MTGDNQSQLGSLQSSTLNNEKYFIKKASTRKTDDKMGSNLYKHHRKNLSSNFKVGSFLKNASTLITKKNQKRYKKKPQKSNIEDYKKIQSILKDKTAKSGAHPFLFAGDHNKLKNITALQGQLTKQFDYEVSENKKTDRESANCPSREKTIGSINFTESFKTNQSNSKRNFLK